MTSDDPRSWSYVRKYERPNIHIFKTLLYITIAIVASYYIAKLIHTYLYISFIFSLIVILFLITIIFSKQICIYLVHVYQRFAPISIRSKCRFEPSCSQYMILAIQKYGTILGIQKGINRIYRCSHGGGGYENP